MCPILRIASFGLSEFVSKEHAMYTVPETQIIMFKSVQT